MTVREVLRAITRRWYVLAIALLCALLLGILFTRGSGTFTTKTLVSFTLPARSTLQAESGNSDTSVIAFASAVAAEINNGKPTPTYSSADAPYYGAGVREGVLVGLRNEGGQWIASFPSATIEIQIVGRTYEWVENKQKDLLEDVENTAIAQQSAALTTPEQRITMTVEPLTTKIDEILVSRTSQIAAWIALVLAALIAGTSACVGWDGIMAARRHGRQAKVRPLPRLDRVTA
ncbi:hypothetical protein GCM10025760_00120 [Microbacterium yannicii]|uniref:Polysaccharide chain length determinant N-terminal domain-containing protein n=1 Tax=Microbacterium yannicii TaxID=671622 RepID=A0ABP9LU26_9MICO|nr:hypothetical protein [Microbacterium yannicii]MCO5952334.1 hypothetical protein [Microbacterium yannicii]